MTLGPMIAVISMLETAHGRLANVLMDFGRVPFSFYIPHIPLIHVAAVAVSLLREGRVNAWLPANHPMGNPPPPDGYAWALPLLYLVTFIVAAILYVRCPLDGRAQVATKRSLAALPLNRERARRRLRNLALPGAVGVHHPDFHAAGPVALKSDAISASLLVKHVTAFHPLLFSRRVRRPGLSNAAIAAPYVVLAISFVPFLAAWRSIWASVVVYGTRGAKPGGLLAMIDIPRYGAAVRLVLFGAAVLWAIRKGRDLELPRAALILWLAILTFLPSYGIQYLVWPLAVGALYPSVGLGLYSLAGALFHSSWSLEIEWPVRASSLATWVAGLVWLITETARVREERLRAIQPPADESALV